MSLSKQHILDAIRESAVDGKPLGMRAFARATGIRKADWFGIHWSRWSDAVAEAGFAPNRKKSRFDDENMVRRLALLTRELGRFPRTVDIRMKKKAEPSFPGDTAFRRLGNHATLANLVLEMCGNDEAWADVRELAKPAAAPASRTRPTPTSEDGWGYVYLLKAGKHYKIGRSNAPGRRESELRIQLPERASMLHEIRTDDPVGIEAYWHNRFADRRLNGEWFDLSAEDIAAFRRRKKFM